MKMKDLGKWMLNSACQDIKLTHFNPDESIYDWYAALAESGQVFDNKQLISSQSKYRDWLKLQLVSKYSKKSD